MRKYCTRVNFLKVYILNFRLDECFATEKWDPENEFIYCKDVEGMMSAIHIEYHAEEWRLFIDSGQGSLKVVLLSNGSIHPSVPIGYGRGWKESYDQIKWILNKIGYFKHCWKIIADFKMIGILLGLQVGNVGKCITSFL